ncbi:hypothetical protein [Mucisphaera calidilacus]|uniref:Uncharacterized protein n=1 Tax=Mucisphaera calidilacus TaxID=2527982 RepID=A0A518BVP5_9BACT|nr:hypothetical protein [Mucisphaera calidilacus]QDU71014.1 hypothetical protein Pan265_08590 [Mucisphaera calidilacus]
MKTGSARQSGPAPAVGQVSLPEQSPNHHRKQASILDQDPGRGASSSSEYKGNSMYRFTHYDLLFFGLSLFLCIGAICLASNVSRDQARGSTCVSNLRQLVHADLVYANDYDGQFFSDWSYKKQAKSPPRQYWCDKRRLGQYIQQDRVDWIIEDSRNFTEGQDKPLQAINGIMRCPASLEDEARSYSQSHWANGLGLFTKWIGAGEISRAYPLGKHFNTQSVKNPSKTILLVESLAKTEIIQDKYWGTEEVGAFKLPSLRCAPQKRVWESPVNVFSPTEGRYVNAASITWDVNYSNHRTRNNITYDPRRNPGPLGVVSIGFVDGHVQSVSSEAIWSPDTFRSVYNILWSDNDKDIDSEYFK